ncbi:hypothetical protein NP233_g3481 [Leucocoprinus birnbaumii]|uniref:Uncharacterized protein n=1 Tax=Leucocoprinus birnbaumii TaxID=56174 RepID=A0AAD5YYA7_9AGAR|nr:hypothetical protein NP233_g3481 [Leucocoprinus birnbaumii]
MKIPAISSAVYCVELPVSRDIDHEILLFLTDEFAKIRESHGLPKSWPSEEVLALLVDRVAGLWIYVSTIVRFINGESLLGPEDQLEIVLRFISDVSKKVEPNNPLAEMDHFYTLIMERVPSNMIEVVRRVLLLCSITPNSYMGARVLGLSEQQLRRCCVFIQSVVELKRVYTSFLDWYFYHASFGDHLKDPNPSPFQTNFHTKQLRANLPIELQNKIFRKQKCPVPGCTAAKPVLILGHGSDEVFLHPDEINHLWVQYDQNEIPIPAGNCPCGAEFQDAEAWTNEESGGDDDSDDSDNEEEEDRDQDQETNEVGDEEDEDEDEFHG